MRISLSDSNVRALLDGKYVHYLINQPVKEQLQDDLTVKPLWKIKGGKYIDQPEAGAKYVGQGVLSADSKSCVAIRMSEEEKTSGIEVAEAFCLTPVGWDIDQAEEGYYVADFMGVKRLISYKADTEKPFYFTHDPRLHWRPADDMPGWASRIKVLPRKISFCLAKEWVEESLHSEDSSIASAARTVAADNLDDHSFLWHICLHLHAMRMLRKAGE